MSIDRRVSRDPVCGRKMNRNKAWAVVTYNRIEYLLCCPRCQAEFESSPETWLRNSGKKH